MMAAQRSLFFFSRKSKSTAGISVQGLYSYFTTCQEPRLPPAHNSPLQTADPFLMACYDASAPTFASAFQQQGEDSGRKRVIPFLKETSWKSATFLI